MPRLSSHAGVYSASGITLADTDEADLQMDSSGNVKVNVATGTVTATIPSTTTVGTTSVTTKTGQTTSNTSAVQLTATSIAMTNGIVVKALSTNAATVFIGDSGVTTANGYELLPGEASVFTAANINLLYVIGANNSDKVCWSVE